MKTSRSSSAVSTMRDLSGRRSLLSRITRRSLRRRCRPLRSVSSGLSARIVPIPVSSASEAWRMRCTSARDSSLVIHTRFLLLRDSGKASCPSSVSADFRVTNGLCVAIQQANASLSFCASDSITPVTTSTPLVRSFAKPVPRVLGLGSSIAATTRVMPAFKIASVQGPVRPVWLQGSSVT